MTDKKANRREALAGLTALASLTATKATAQSHTATPRPSAAFDLADIAAKNAATDGPWFEFFDNNTMFAGLYELPAQGSDQQRPHQQDELYFVTKGQAQLIAGDETYAATPGAILFVKAGITHRFVDIEEDLQLLVFFSKADPKG